METPKDLEKYQSSYSETSLSQKLESYAKKAGLKVIYIVLLLNYVLKSGEVSQKDKALILGTLGYFILPIDLIPDFIPVVGYTDDFAALVFVISKVSGCITPTIKENAIKKLHKWFGDFDEDQLNGIW